MSTQSGAGQPQPFKINIPSSTLDAIMERVRSYPWDKLQTIPHIGWQLGIDASYLKELAAYWVQGYDWQAQEIFINRFQHYTAVIDDQVLHFVHELGSGQNPQTLLLLHGWPYSFYSFLDVIEPLAHPERFGKDSADSFNVVVVSLPGFGFSTPLAQPLGPQKMGDLINRLMTDVLGYTQYIVQGGDFGGYIASRLGFDHAEHVKGVLSNSYMVRHFGSVQGSGQADQDATSEELAFAKQEQQNLSATLGYAIIQATRPLDLAVAMIDSPVGVAAWIVEKFYEWSDKRTRPFETVFSQDHLLTEVMIYLVTNTFNTSTWIYGAYFMEQSAMLPPGKRVEVPSGFMAYPDPVFAAPPQSLMERSHNVVRWTVMPEGGHFPMLEAPEAYMDEVRAFARLLR